VLGKQEAFLARVMEGLPDVERKILLLLSSLKMKSTRQSNR
jgi:hypothetical protein